MLVTIVDEHDWMICGELEQFVHVGRATKWIHKISLFPVSVRQQDTSRELD